MSLDSAAGSIHSKSSLDINLLPKVFNSGIAGHCNFTTISITLVKVVGAHLLTSAENLSFVLRNQVQL